MIEKFVDLVGSGNAEARAAYASAATATQSYLDAVWTAAT